jgi:hypothetical protein
MALQLKKKKYPHTFKKYVIKILNQPKNAKISQKITLSKSRQHKTAPKSQLSILYYLVSPKVPKNTQNDNIFILPVFLPTFLREKG